MRAYDMQTAIAHTSDQQYLVEKILADRCIREINTDIEETSRRGQTRVTAVVQRVFPGWPVVKHSMVVDLVVRAFQEGGYDVTNHGGGALAISWMPAEADSQCAPASAWRPT